MEDKKEDLIEAEKHNGVTIQVGEVLVQLQSSDENLDQLTERIKNLFIELTNKKEKKSNMCG